MHPPSPAHCPRHPFAALHRRQLPCQLVVSQNSLQSPLGGTMWSTVWLAVITPSALHRAQRAFSGRARKVSRAFFQRAESYHFFCRARCSPRLRGLSCRGFLVHLVHCFPSHSPGHPGVGQVFSVRAGMALLSSSFHSPAFERLTKTGYIRGGVTIRVVDHENQRCRCHLLVPPCAYTSPLSVRVQNAVRCASSSNIASNSSW